VTQGFSALIDDLLACDEQLPSSLRERVVAEGPPIIPALIDVLMEEDDEDVEEDAGGWASIHAVGLLVDLKAEAAILPMLRVLAETDWDHIIHDRIVLRLPELGAPVLEPALSMLAEDPRDDLAESLCAIASQLGVRDERVFEHLVSRFPECPEMASCWLADYGDPRGVALIEEGIRSLDPEEDAEFGPVLLRDLISSYERLAGVLPKDLRAYADVLMAIWNADMTPPPAIEPARSSKVGRNEPCPCGSGKKYKRCHLGADLA
jgi:hypothetical protein